MDNIIAQNEPEEHRMIFGVVYLNNGVQTNWFESKACAIEFADFIGEDTDRVKIIVDKRPLEL